MTTLTFNPGLAYAEYNQRKAAYIIAALVAFTMSSYFVVGYLAGSLLFWNWDVSQTMNGVVGVGICFVMTAYQFILYSQGDVEGGRKATILAVCVAVGFSLLSEVGQGMERDHVRMETKSIESPTYQALIGKISTTASGAIAHPYSRQLQHAEMKLARCQQKVGAGEWEDCVESTARLNSVQNTIQQFYQQNQQNALALTDKAKTLEKDESNYHPLVNLIKNTLSSTGVVASFILSLILIAFFEYAFHYLGRQLAAKRAELLANGFDVTRRNRKTPKALKRMQENNRPSPDQEEAPETAPETANTWNDELDKSGLASPADTALNQVADPEQAQRIIERGQSVSESVHHTPESVRRTVYGSSEEGEKLSLELRRKRFYKLLYAEVKNLVLEGDVKPTVRPVTDAVITILKHKGHALGVKQSLIKQPQRQQIAQMILEHLEQEDIVVRNKEGGVGKPKYLLAEKYRKQILDARKKQMNSIPQEAQLV